MTPLLASIIVVMLLMGAGCFIERSAFHISSRRDDLSAPIHAIIVGWAALSIVAVFCALFGLNLRWPLAVLGVFSVIGVALIKREEILRVTLAWLLLAPLLLIATAIPPTMFDEFSQWLPNARFLVEHERFPDVVNVNVWSAKPSYPPAFPLVGFAAELIGGKSFEIAPKVFSVLLGGGFGLLLAQCVGFRHSPPLAIVIGVIFATVLNPFFDPRVALTAYTDTPSSLVLAFCVYAAWQALEGQERRALLWAGSGAIVLVLLRETNAVFILAMALALTCFGRRGLAPLAAIAVPAALVFLLWRSYIALAVMPPAMSPRPFSEWDWGAPVAVMRSLLLERLAGNLLVATIACGFAVGLAAVSIVTLRRAGPQERRLVILAGTVIVAWAGFLTWAYIAVFTPEEVQSAASTWRYLAQLGPLAILLCFCLFPQMLQKRDRWAGAWTTKPSVLILFCLTPTVFVVLTQPYWQIDCQYPDRAVVHSLAQRLSTMNLGNSRIVVVHPTEANFHALAIDYDLHRRIGSSVPAQNVSAAGREGLLLDLSIPSPAYVLKRWSDGNWTGVAELAVNLKNCRPWSAILPAVAYK